MRVSGPATVLVTGATGGIGRALAGCYAAPGRTLLLHGRDRQGLLELSARCTDRGARVHLLEHDLRDVAGWMAKLSALPELAAVDLALVNAGVAGTSTDGREDWAAVQAMLDVNLSAAMATVQVLAEPMRRRGSGQIALVGSLSAWVGMPISPAYCATKAGLKAYAEAMRGALAPSGVAVTIVMPGFVESAMSERFPGPRPMRMTADAAAMRIRKALERRPARIAFPFWLALGMRVLAGLPPDWAQRILAATGYGTQNPPKL